MSEVPVEAERLARLIEIARRCSQNQAIEAEVPIVDLGIDSLMLMDIIFDAEELYPGISKLETLDVSLRTDFKDLDRQFAQHSREWLARSR